MRIISSFHDFYDSVMRTGMDRNIVYLREPKEIVLDSNYGIDFSTSHSLSVRNHLNLEHGYYTLNQNLLGYCGHIYKIYTLENTTSFKKIFYNYEDFKNYVIENGLLSKYDFSRHFYLTDYQKYHIYDGNKLKELFHKYQTPLFLVTYTHHSRILKKAILHTNPRLKDFDFFKIKDAYTTYQDIFQYVSGILNAPENKMVKVSDKDKVHKHGFDKWSFRKKSSKKK